MQQEQLSSKSMLKHLKANNEPKLNCICHISWLKLNYAVSSNFESAEFAGPETIGPQNNNSWKMAPKLNKNWQQMKKQHQENVGANKG